MKIRIEKLDGIMETFDEEMPSDTMVLLLPVPDRVPQVFLFESYGDGGAIEVFREVVPHVISRFPSEMGPPVTGGGSGA